MKRIMALTLGMACLVCLLFVGTTPESAHAALTVSTTAADEWAEVAQNAVREGAATTISDCYRAQVYIGWALTSETAHTGTKITIQLSAHATSDEHWYDMTSFVVGIGTPNSEALAGAETGGAATVLEVASTLGLYDDDGTRQIFIEDNTVADSELVLLVSHVANTSVTVQDAIVNSHDASDTLFDIAGSRVITLPCPAPLRVRVIYDNTYDSDGATCHTFSEVIEVTGV